MRNTSVIVAALSLSTLAWAADEGKVDLTSDKGRISYTLGQQIGTHMRDQGPDIDLDTLFGAIRDAQSGKPSRMKEDEMQASMMKLREQMQEKQVKLAKTNKEEADKFLAQHKTEKDVKTTASGLQYKVVTEGKGTVPSANATVKVHYKGTLLSGTEFDSSYKRNEPAVFPVKGVIPGWTEALTMMKPGAKWELSIPPELAYGEAGRPGIPPNSVLNFTVELIEVMKEDVPAAAPGKKTEKKVKKVSAKADEDTSKG